MSSSWNVSRTSLDNSLNVLSTSLEKLKAAQPLDIPSIVDNLTIAAESARNLRAYVQSELPEANWTNRTELDALLAKIEGLQRNRAIERVRTRLLALAAELGNGQIVHRRAARVDQLNQLRSEAIEGLRLKAVEPLPQELPGPQTEIWIDWACALKEPEDSEALGTLCNSFPPLYEFVVNLDRSMWVGASEGKSREQAPPPPKPPAATSNSAAAGNAAASSQPPVAFAENAVATDDAVRAAVPSAFDKYADDVPADQPGKKLPVNTVAIAGAAVVLLAIVGAFEWSTHKGADNNAVRANERKIETPAPAPVPATPVLLHKQPDEGAQDKILLTVESCARKNQRNIECWGYVSNLRSESSDVSLSRSDVIDGKGNTFNLTSNGQFDFDTGRNSSIAPGSNAKYTLKIPDVDPSVKTLTVYLDVSRPRGLEYTFRDVPINE